jgi:hypothetical protein
MNIREINIIRHSGKSTIAAIAVIFGAGIGAEASLADVDGIIGSDWLGVTPQVVLYDPGAATGNFGAPGNTNHLTGYNVYIRSDDTYIYGAFETQPLNIGVPQFVNLYLDTDPSTNPGSDVGFEITLNQAFIPGVPGYFTGPDYTLTYAQTPGTIEVAIPWSYLQTDPQGIGFPVITETNNEVTFRLVQAFGYSVAGGSSYGPERLGLAVLASSVPEPATGLAGVLLATFLGGMRRRPALSM